MPKEVALQLAVMFAEISKPTKPAKDVAFELPVDALQDAAMSLMSSAAARARDSDSCEFPLLGLEAIARTGLGWTAFSNMFLAAFHAQLQREAKDSRVLVKALARRVASVFVWASCHADLQATLLPAGRRVIQAAHNALVDECDVNTVKMLERLAVRP